MKTHSMKTKYLKCPIDFCHVSLKSLNRLKLHLYGSHLKIQNVKFPSLTCSKIGCGFLSTTQAGIKKHMRKHLHEGENIKCPFPSCNTVIRNINSFSSHIHRKHKGSDVNFTNNVGFENEEIMTENVEMDIMDFEGNQLIEEPTTEVIDEQNLSIVSSKKNFIAFSLKCQSNYFIPARIYSEIITEFRNLHQISQDSLYRDLKNMENVSDSKVEKELFSTSMFDQTLKSLQTQHLREKTYTKNFLYIEPKAYTLSPIGVKPFEQFHYIPLKQTLQTYVNLEHVKFQIMNPYISQCASSSSYTDMSDGEIFKNTTDDMIKIILYTDEFEVCNPIGSYRKKHKRMAFYFILCNLYPWNRSKVQDIQLVLLCKSSSFKKYRSDILKVLVGDIIDLERDGIELDGKKLKFRLMCISGDNLGSNGIGGFIESFSLTNYFCRFCSSHPSDYLVSPNQYELRTVEDYQKIVDEKTSQTHVKGIKYDSEFNKLQNFHVMMPGLPPCIAHDLLEGVMKKDLALYIKALIDEGKTSYEELNNNISKFNHDVKPAYLIPGKNLVGSATQIWVFTRFFPLFLEDQSAFDSIYWQLIDLLRQITVLVFSPALSENQLGVMNELISTYIEERKNLFPSESMLPKHHILEHYPVLFRKFGPLVHMWTLRFESKHKYFKDAVRSIRNFKRLTHSLAVKHQMYQAFLCSRSDPGSLMINSIYSFNINIVSDVIKEALASSLIQTNGLKFCEKIVYRNTSLKTGQILLYHSHDLIYYFGRIVSFLISDEDPVKDFNILLRKVNSCKKYMDSISYFIEDTNSFVCVKSANVNLTYPLDAINVPDGQIVIMKFCPFDRS